MRSLSIAVALVVSTALTAAESAPSTATGSTLVSFDDVDRNRDGLISRREAASFSTLEMIFDMMDVNRDGSLEAKEFIRIRTSPASH